MAKRKILLIGSEIFIMVLLATFAYGNNLYEGMKTPITSMGVETLKGIYNISQISLIRVYDDILIDSDTPIIYQGGMWTLIEVRAGDDYKVWIETNNTNLTTPSGYMVNGERKFVIYQFDGEISLVHIGETSDIYNISLSAISGRGQDYIWTDNMLTNGSLVNNTLIAYFKLNKDASEEIGGYDGVIYNADNTSGRFGEDNTALNFNGSGDYILITDEAPFRIVGDMAISIWANLMGRPQNAHSYLFTVESHDGNQKGIILKYLTTDNKYHFYLGNSTNTLGCDSDSTYTDGWTHIVGVRDGNTMMLYIDGVLQADTETIIGDTAFESARLVQISWRDSGWYFNGSIDNLRVYNRSISAEEVWALYEERNDNYLNGSVSQVFCIDNCINDTDILLQWRLNGDATDYYGNYDGTNSGGIPTSAGCRYGDCFYFDSDNDVITTTDLVNISTTKGTVCVWIKPEVCGGGANNIGYRGYIFEAWQAGNDLAYFGAHTDCTLYFGQWALDYAQTTSAVPLNEWSHACGSWDGSNFRVYIDGVLASPATGTGIMPSGADSFRVGYPLSVANDYQGFMDNLIIYNRTLPNDEIWRLYLSGYERHIENATLQKINYDGDVEGSCSFFNASWTATQPPYTSYTLDWNYSNFEGYHSNSTGLSYLNYSSNATIDERSDFGICKFEGTNFNYINFTFADELLGVGDTTPPVFGAYDNISITDTTDFSYDFNATDETGLGIFWISDTGNFTINYTTGIMTNATTLSVGTYLVDVHVNDTSNNNATITFNLTIIPKPTVELGFGGGFFFYNPNIPYLGECSLGILSCERETENITNYYTTTTEDSYWNRTGTNTFLSNINDNVGIGTITPTQALEVKGLINVTQTTGNSTFLGDVTIEGTLYGGSPVKISGINISNNLFELMEDRNSSSRFTLQNTNSGSNATTIITAKNDVGGSMNIGVGSSNFMIGTKSYKNITALFSKSKGETIFANFYNQMFLWLYNPSDDNDPNNLVEVMRLDENGLNVSGNITAENVFIPHYIFSHTNATIQVIGAGDWTNITFDQENADVKYGVLHTANDNTNHTFTIMEDGIYNVDYDFDVEDTSVGASDIDVAGRLILSDGTEVLGSVFETDITKQGTETELSHNFLVECRVGEVFIFQFVADDADVQLSTHGTFGEHPESASVLMYKIANIP